MVIVSFSEFWRFVHCHSLNESLRNIYIHVTFDPAATRIHHRHMSVVNF